MNSYVSEAEQSDRKKPTSVVIDDNQSPEDIVEIQNEK